jgi:transcriptional regulator with XRE-family HTH domain
VIKNSASLVNLLGELVKKLRTKNLWSQEQFAGISGISIRTLQRIEAGEKANAETLRAIASVLDMSAAELVPLNAAIDAEEFARFEAQAQKEMQMEMARLEKELHVLPRMRNGKELLSAVESVQALHTDYPPPISEEEGTAIATLLSMVRDYAEVHRELEPQQEIECVLEASGHLEALHTFGLAVFAGKLRGSIVVPSPSNDVESLRIRYGGLFVCRAADINTFTDSNNEDRESFRFRVPFGPVSFR